MEPFSTKRGILPAHAVAESMGWIGPTRLAKRIGTDPPTLKNACYPRPSRRIGKRWYYTREEADLIEHMHGLQGRKIFPEHIELMHALREQGWSQKKIGEALGVCQPVVSRYLSR